jgi:hypothetical protein
MEIRHIVDGKIVSINGVPVVEETKKRVSKPTPTPNEEINIEDSANTETETRTDEE